jgi:crotonobetainyl-CoA:carnitine CoA-transferase CaiB-like acyl-CoA transferase
MGEPAGSSSERTMRGGPLDGLAVVELSHQHVAFGGKLLGDLGATVTVVEPPGGSVQRTYGPFLDDEPGPERSLWWWHYNTSKRGVVADLIADADRLRALVAAADVLLTGEEAAVLEAAGLDWPSVSAANPRLVMASITPFGMASSRASEAVTDLTLLAEGGPAWSCGYDDHSLPPVRGGGNQAAHTACNWAVMSVLVALLSREETGQGQWIDVNMLAASNVTTEMATYGWLMAGAEVQRQTGRHAAHFVTPTVQVRCRDGRYATTGVPPRDPATFRAVLDLLDRLGLRDEFPASVVLEIGAERDRPINFGDAASDPMVAELMTTGRDVVWFLAEHMSAYDFFVETQSIGLATGIIYTPGEAMADPHFVARGFPVEIEHPELGRSFAYPGAPYRFTATPWSARRAPLLGEHQADLDPSASNDPGA